MGRKGKGTMVPKHDANPKCKCLCLCCQWWASHCAKRLCCWESPLLLIGTDYVKICPQPLKQAIHKPLNQKIKGRTQQPTQCHQTTNIMSSSSNDLLRSLLGQRHCIGKTWVDQLKWPSMTFPSGLRATNQKYEKILIFSCSSLPMN